MPNIKPISNTHDCEQVQATLRLMNALIKGHKSGEASGWLTLEDVEKQLKIPHDDFLK